MRINRWYIGAGSLLVLFFGFLGYQQVFVNDVAIATSVAEQKVTAAASTPQQVRVDFGAKRALIALQEYNKDIAEEVAGCNCGPEIDKYTEGSPAQWCTMFVSWVSREAGSPLVDPTSGSWKITNSRIFTDYLKQNGTFYSKEQVKKEDIQPKAGDFIIFYRGKIDDNLGHVDIVIEPKAGGKADLIGGNIRDRMVYRKDFPYKDYYGFLGIGRPEK